MSGEINWFELPYGVVAQGDQAGGHERATQSLAGLLPQVLQAVSPLLVLGAGGIADGRTAADVLAVGADGVWVGTRFVATVEANAHEACKRRIVAADSGRHRPHHAVRPRVAQCPGASAPRSCHRRAGREAEAAAAPPAVIGRTTFAGQPYEMPRFSALLLPTPADPGRPPGNVPGGWGRVVRANPFDRTRPPGRLRDDGRGMDVLGGGARRGRLRAISARAAWAP